MNEIIWDDSTWLVAGEFMFTSFNSNTLLVLFWILKGGTLAVVNIFLLCFFWCEVKL